MDKQTTDQFFEQHCHLNNQTQRCYLMMRECEIETDIFAQKAQICQE